MDYIRGSYASYKTTEEFTNCNDNYSRLLPEIYSKINTQQRPISIIQLEENRKQRKIKQLPPSLLQEAALSKAELEQKQADWQLIFQELKIKQNGFYKAIQKLDRMNNDLDKILQKTQDNRQNLKELKDRVLQIKNTDSSRQAPSHMSSSISTSRRSSSLPSPSLTFTFLFGCASSLAQISLLCSLWRECTAVAVAARQ